MKLCRFQPLVFAAPDSRAPVESHPPVRFGRIDENSVRELTGDFASGFTPGAETWPLEDVRLLPPSVPSKIVCVGRNYRAHASELGNELPREPLIFFKPPSSLIATGEPIVLPSVSKRVDYEGELALVIGRRCSQLADTQSATPFIFGFSCLNDVTARDLQNSDGQWSRAKGFDTFCPFGPVIETELDLAAARLETFVNGVRKQFGTPSEMIFSLDVIIRWISRVMTLEPGDVIATGTPAGVSSLAPGDVVEVSVTGVGTLRNEVRVAGS
jgi:2-keto-4-pentenoate hydratase/2-oxohepta-3-ene-1,7-dioic acid hydratase in catechol pathway